MYVHSRRACRPSTTLISSRISAKHIRYAKVNGFNFNKWANRALETYVHDLQTDYDVDKDKYWLRWSGGVFTPYDTDHDGLQSKMLRIQTHLIEYLKINQYKVNTALNLALDRWERYRQNGRVAEYVIADLQRRGKY